MPLPTQWATDYTRLFDLWDLCEAAGINRWQRTKSSRLVNRHINAHICSSTNFGSRNAPRNREIFFSSPTIFSETRLDRDSLTSLALTTVCLVSVSINCTNKALTVLPVSPLHSRIRTHIWQCSMGPHNSRSDAANISKNWLQLTHSLQPNNTTNTRIMVDLLNSSD